VQLVSQRRDTMYARYSPFGSVADDWNSFNAWISWLALLGILDNNLSNEDNYTLFSVRYLIVRGMQC